MIIIPIKWLYIIGNIPYFQTNPHLLVSRASRFTSPRSPGFQTSQPIQVRFEPLGRILRRLLHRIVQEALPLKECQVPGEVPNLTGSIEQRKDHSTRKIYGTSWSITAYMGWMLMWRPSQHSYNKEVQGSLKTSKPTRPNSHAREPKAHQHQPRPRRERYLEPGRKLQRQWWGS